MNEFIAIVCHLLCDWASEIVVIMTDEASSMANRCAGIVPTTG